MIIRILTIVNSIVLAWLVWAVTETMRVNAELGDAMVYMAKILTIVAHKAFGG